ncbi:hypothetical protein [Galbibacter sp. PAP.153]|uniref:hypothetical protein n=1 Tax=Galbibacter sp. PAP.153 TaxID=3104623 RepID=UPI00300848CE
MLRSRHKLLSPIREMAHKNKDNISFYEFIDRTCMAMDESKNLLFYCTYVNEKKIIKRIDLNMVLSAEIEHLKKTDPKSKKEQTFYLGINLYKYNARSPFERLMTYDREISPNCPPEFGETEKWNRLINTRTFDNFTAHVME